MAPRIPPASPDTASPEVRDAMALTGPAPDGRPWNVFATLAQHPTMFRSWWTFGGALFRDGVLSARDRELLLLRTGWNCRSEYEWAQHVRVGKAAGLTDEEIVRITAGPDAPGWDAFDATLLRAADELHRDSRISDRTWGELAARYSTEQLIESVLAVGQYHLVSMALNSFGVELDPGLEGWPA